jgi:serine/threonine protein kinase
MTDTIEYHNTLPIGYRLQDYEIQAIIGVGGFGITYLAKDMHLNHKVAIKEYFPNDLAVRDNTHSVQPKSQQDSQGFAWGLERFIQEARTLAQFKHLNIVRVLRFFEGHNTGYIVMEYERGQSLEEALKGGETATEEELMTILPPLLDALGTLHNANFLHRDIKPSNIYLRDKDNSPVLIDFGAARYDVSSRSRSVTSIVTPGYAPFEQYESDGSRQGAWTDIYALGAVLYRTIGGERPTEATKRIGDTMRGRPDPLKPAVEVGRVHYSKRLLQGIDWALQVLEKDRPQTVAAWAEVLLGKFSKPSKPVIKPNGQKIGEKATETAPTQQPASLDKRGETAPDGFINKVFFVDKSVIRVINWGFITVAMSFAGALIGLYIVPDILIKDHESAFGLLIALLCAGILAYPMVYKFLSVQKNFSADAVYLFGLMNVPYHYTFLVLFVHISDYYIFNGYLIGNSIDSILKLLLFFLIIIVITPLMLPIISIFFKYKHGYKNIGFKSFFVFLFKLPFLLPIWVVQAVVDDIRFGIKLVGNRLSR